MKLYCFLVGVLVLNVSVFVGVLNYTRGDRLKAIAEYETKIPGMEKELGEMIEKDIVITKTISEITNNHTATPPNKTVLMGWQQNKSRNQENIKNRIALIKECKAFLNELKRM